jgi:preprotein translocase subunit SecD
MASIRKWLACLLLFLVAACSSEAPIEGHQPRLVAVDQPDATWLTSEDIRAVEVTKVTGARPMLRVHLKPDAAARMEALTRANIGKSLRVIWDGNVVSDVRIMAGFGSPFELPAPDGKAT